MRPKNYEGCGCGRDLDLQSYCSNFVFHIIRRAKKSYLKAVYFMYRAWLLSNVFYSLQIFKKTKLGTIIGVMKPHMDAVKNIIQNGYFDPKH